MVEARGSLCLAEKPGLLIFVLQGATREEFQGSGAFEREVLGLIDGAHPAFADFAADLVVGNGPADHRITSILVAEAEMGRPSIAPSVSAHTLSPDGLLPVGIVSEAQRLR